MNELPEQALSALDTVTGRRSIRRFLPVPVAEQTVRAILQAATRAVLAAAHAEETSLEYHYLPERLKEPHRSRRRKLGHDLYALYGIDRDGGGACPWL